MLLSLPLEILTRIVSLVYGPNRQDVLALCLACKAMQVFAEPLLFEQINVPIPLACLAVCKTLAENPRLALHVRRFVFAADSRHTRRPSPPGEALWSAIQSALEKMTQLNFLLLSDTTFSHSWVFGSPTLPTRLRELRIRVAWDAHTVSFVSRQKDLRFLQVYDAIDDAGSVQHRFVAIQLPALETFDGTLSIGVQFTICHILRMQLTIDCESQSALALLARFAPLHGSLRALSLLDVSEEMTLPIFELLLRILPDLHHIGILPYPVTTVSKDVPPLQIWNTHLSCSLQRHRLHRCLMHMHHLHSVEVDISRWPGGPGSSTPAVQRLLADELRVYCPSLRLIVFWLSPATRVRWTVNGGRGARAQQFGAAHDLWQTRAEQGIYQQLGEIWKLV